MSKTIQHYKMKATAEHLSDAKPGQFVMDREGEAVIGFIDYVSDCEVAAILFDPQYLFVDETDLPEGFQVIAEDGVDWRTRLNEILEENPAMWELWEVE